ncbi:polynucleotide adenylyltransferase PcnB [Kangiella sp. TOML190]|uniref:polynucleotide adenylyltransferase PcnB n=1 Tax=Kangiella sp. TOML190 TaxID=2931351 RepID=UPI00203DE83C|nr:polynucleotide adenylyltransferase PcnB [Kangiella sp. TOML190]
MTNPNQSIIPRDQHSVSRDFISDNALKVLYRLHKGGYQAFLVGGGVRDILLGLRPKDFDIATDATPEQVKKLFRNCRIIGRRFRLAHILYGRDIIEVATFRAHCDDNIEQGADGMIVRDNVYGTVEEDAIRRDFTVNALYYNIADFSIHDYCGGLADLEKRQLKMIGDPVERYREDPVRMLRAVRLGCKLNLTIEQQTAKPIAELAQLLEGVPAARLWEEYKKMFLSGKGQRTFNQLKHFGLLPYLFPQTSKAMAENDDFAELVTIALENTDSRLRDDKTVNPAFLQAVMLWQPLLDKTEKLVAKGMGFNDAFYKSMNPVINQQSQTVSVMRRYAGVIQDIWALQIRLKTNYGKRVWSLLEHPRFRAAYDFLLLRAEIDPSHQRLADWWTEFQEASREQRLKMLAKSKSKGSKRRPRKRKSRANH